MQGCVIQRTVCVYSLLQTRKVVTRKCGRVGNLCADSLLMLVTLGPNRFELGSWMVDGGWWQSANTRRPHRGYKQ